MGVKRASLWATVLVLGCVSGFAQACSDEESSDVPRCIPLSQRGNLSAFGAAQGIPEPAATSGATDSGASKPPAKTAEASGTGK